MRIPFRQGIVQYKHPTFLQVDFPYVNLVADVSAPLIMTLAAGQTDYLHAEKANVSHAWGPVAIGIDTWLYIDIDTRTAQRTFGSTALEPISGANPPISPAADQHWFDTTSNNLKVWTGTAWIEKIRVFACMLQGGQVPVSMSINSPDFAGTQVGNLTSISAGYILFDTNNAPIKTSNNTFITSEDSLRVNSLSASDVKVGSLIVEAISTGNIPAFSVVEFSDFGKITIASTFVTTTRKQYGIIQKSVVTGEAVNVSIDGPITNLDWDWSTEGVNAYLFNDVNGNLVSSPAIAEQPPVAIVVDRHTIMLLVKVIIINLPPSIATTSTAGIVKIATSPASPSNPIVVGDNDPRLTNARIPVDHEHPISDIVDLQTTLDALESDKLNLAGGTLTGSLILHDDPVVPLEAVTKQYVDNAIEGLFWQQPISDPDMKDDSLNTPPVTTTSETYIIGPTPTGAWSGMARHVVYWNGSSWIDVLGRAVQSGDRFGICMEFALTPGGSFIGRSNYIAEISGIGGSDITYVFTTPVRGQAVLVDATLSRHFGDQYTYNGTEWVEFAGTTFLDDHADVAILNPITGQALTFDGTKWINATPVSALSGLSDVQLTSVASGELLTYNGSKWVNAQLPTVNASPGTYGSTTQIPSFTVNNKGLVTNVTNVAISTDINDLVPTQTGNDGKFLSTDGAVVSWDDPVPTQYTSNLYSCGYGDAGVLGNGTSSNIHTLTSFASDKRAIAVGGSSYAVSMIDADHKLWTWGRNFYGELGDGTAANKSSPIQIGTDVDWVSLSSGVTATNTAAIKQDGSLWTWGDDSYGQLGHGNFVGTQYTPTKIGSLSNISVFTDNTIEQSITYNFVGDVGATVSTTPTAGTLSLGYWEIPLPFNITVYGEIKNKVYVNTGCYVSFDTGIIQLVTAEERQQTRIELGPNNQIATQIYYQTIGVAPTRKFVVGYIGENSGFYTGTDEFELVFSESNPSVIELHFAQVNGPLSGGNPVSVYPFYVPTKYHWNYNVVSATDIPSVAISLTTNVPTVVSTPGIPTYDWAQAACGYSHTAAIKTNGTLWTWGSNYIGQLGNGNTTANQSPIQIGSLTNWAQVSCGYDYNVAVKTNGTLWAWGAGGNGRLGLNNSISRSSPVQVGTLTNWKQVSTGNRVTLAVKTDGTLWGWGDGYNNEIPGYFGEILSPVQIGADTTWNHVKCGQSHIIAQKIDGTLWGWGQNHRGQLGLGYTSSSVNSPMQIGSLTNWSFPTIGMGYAYTVAFEETAKKYVYGVDVSGGTTGLTTTGGPIYTEGTITLGGTLAISNGGTGATTQTGALYNILPDPTGHANQAIVTDGSTIGWGDTPSLTTPSEKILQTLYSCGYDGWAGQLGNSTVFGSKSSPVQIGTRTDWKQLAGGANSTVVLKTDGTLWGWGQNGGMLGLGHTNQRSSPTQIGTKNNWKSVSCGWYVTYAVDLSGQLWACGDNYYGQVGDGSTTNTSTLAQIGTLTNWANVSGGCYHAAAIKNDGSLWTWGANDFGQLGLGNIIYRSSPVQVGSLTNWKQVVCGEYFTAAVKTDGTLWAWGSDNAGSLGQNGVLTNRSSPIQVGALTNWTQISAGPVGVIATKTDGTMWAWGYNNFGQLGVGNTTSRSSPTQIGTLTTWRKAVMSNVGEFAGAIKTDGTLWTWGRNANGQLGSNTTTHRSSPVQVGGLNGWVDLQLNYLTTHGLVNTTPYIGNVSYAATVNLDWSVTDVIRITYAGTAMTVNSMIPPPRDGQICTLELTTNATNNTCTFAASANVRFSTTIASYTPTTTAARKDRITFLYDGSTNKFDVISVNKGFV